LLALLLTFAGEGNTTMTEPDEQPVPNGPCDDDVHDDERDSDDTVRGDDDA
jgi:hypothetical protein